MLVKVRNLIKADRKKNPTVVRGASSPKRQCKAAADLLLRRYPVMQNSSLEDSDSIEQHKKAMSEEMAKTRDEAQRVSFTSAEEIVLSKLMGFYLLNQFRES